MFLFIKESMLKKLPPFPGQDGFCYYITLTNSSSWTISCSHPKRAVCFNLHNKVITNGQGNFWPKGLIGIIIEIIPLYLFCDGIYPIRPALKVKFLNHPEYQIGYLDLYETDLANL